MIFQMKVNLINLKMNEPQTHDPKPPNPRQPTGIISLHLYPRNPFGPGWPCPLFIVVTAAKRGFLLPKETWDFPDKKHWPKIWLGTLDIKFDNGNNKANLSLLKAWTPYLFVAVLLVLSRLPHLPFKDFLSGVAISYPGILGTAISASSTPLYLLGTILIVVGLITVFLHRMSLSDVKAAFSERGKMLLGTGFVLVFTVPMVRITSIRGSIRRISRGCPLSWPNGWRCMWG